jgi:DNA topoisomerase IB
MSTEGAPQIGGPPQAAAVAGLARSDPHGPGITRVRGGDGFLYLGPSGSRLTGDETLHRIRALGIPPAWENVWISADPLGHIQATGVDSRGRLQYIYHQLWREQRDAQKFAHMLRFARALPALRAAARQDLRRRGLERDRVLAGVVRLIDLGLFRIGGERYAELDHHYGITTLEKRHVRVTREGILFDYIAKSGQHRKICVTDRVVHPTVASLAETDNGHETLFCYEHEDAWHRLHSREVGNYIAAASGGHFTAKEFRTWNATVLMALVLASAEPPATAQARTRVIAASVREVARALGDTPAVARSSYIDPRLVSCYESEGRLPGIPARPALLPAPAEAETAIAALLATCGDGLVPAGEHRAAENYRP